MSSLNFASILSALSANTRNHVTFRDGEATKRRTFAEVFADAQAVAGALRRMDVTAGSRVGIRLDTEYFWVLLDLACLSIGAVSVPFHADLPDFDAGAVIARFGLRVLIDGQDAVMMRDGQPTRVPRPSVDHGAGDGGPPSAVMQWRDDDPFTILFTSGSTGAAKAIALRIESVTDFLVNVHAMFEFQQDDSVLVFMPLSHFGQRSYIYAAVLFGLDVVISPASDLMAALRRHSPTVMVAVPLFFDGLYQVFRDAPGVTRGDVLRFLGGRVRLLVTGSAPMRPEVLNFFGGLQIPIYEGYGTTETGLITLNHPGRHRPGSVGPVFPNKEVKISPEGEVLVRGPYCWADRYVDQPDAVSEAVFEPDGFIHTGDLGELDDEGFLHLKGRIRDLLVFSNGKKVHPFEIETLLLSSGGATQASVFLVDDTVAAVIVSRDGESRVAAALAAANARLPDYARVRRYAVSEQPFSVENGCLTTSLKISRSRVREAFGDRLCAVAHHSSARVADGRGESQI